MAQTTILAAAKTEATSDDIVLAGNSSVKVGLFGATPIGNIGGFPIMIVTPGADLQIDQLSGSRPVVSLTGPGTFRVVRPAISVAVGVFTEVDAGSGSASTLSAGVDRSGSIAAGGSAQLLAAANLARKSLKGQNISSGDLWINETGSPAQADTAGSYRVGANGTFNISTSRAVSVVGAATGQKWTATET